jgi:hypothetical protein
MQSSGLFDTTLFQSSSYQIILKFILTYPFGFSNFNSNYLTIRHLPICIFLNLLSGSYYQSICFIKCERPIIFCATNVSTHILDYYFIFIFNGFFLSIFVFCTTNRSPDICLYWTTTLSALFDIFILFYFRHCPYWATTSSVPFDIFIFIFRHHPYWTTTPSAPFDIFLFYFYF